VGPAGTTDLRLALGRGLAITGRILDVAGRIVPGLPVSATLEDNSQTEYATSLPDGTFRIDGLVHGRWNLAAGTRLAGYGVRGGVAAGETDVTLGLRRGGVVRLAVSKDGAPAAGAWAAVVSVGGTVVDIHDSGAGGTTGPSGVTELGAPPGTVEIRVRGEAYQGTVRVRVTEGATTAASVELTEPRGQPR
jgi:hypothetical protein